MGGIAQKACWERAMMRWFIVFAAVVAGCSGGSSKVSVGERGVLFWDDSIVDQWIPVYPTRADLDAAIKARNAKDEVGIRQADARAFHVKEGTLALVLDTAFGVREIRILTGSEAGMKGYIPVEWIRHQRE